MVGDGTEMNLVVRTKNNDTSNNFSVKVGNTDKNFSFNFKVENLKIMPGVYNVQVSTANTMVSQTKFQNLIVPKTQCSILI